MSMSMRLRLGVEVPARGTMVSTFGNRTHSIKWAIVCLFSAVCKIDHQDAGGKKFAWHTEPRLCGQNPAAAASGSCKTFFPAWTVPDKYPWLSLSPLSVQIVVQCDVLTLKLPLHHLLLPPNSTDVFLLRSVYLPYWNSTFYQGSGFSLCCSWKVLGMY